MGWARAGEGPLGPGPQGWRRAFSSGAQGGAWRELVLPCPGGAESGRVHPRSPGASRVQWDYGSGAWAETRAAGVQGCRCPGSAPPHAFERDEEEAASWGAEGSGGELRGAR